MNNQGSSTLGNSMSMLSSKIEELKANTKYFQDYKYLIMAMIFQGFAFQILFLSPEFIQEESSSENVGNFLVGLNFALFHTVSIILVLFLSTRSDQKMARKSLLLIIVLFGSIIGFLETFVTLVGFVPLYIILFMLYMASIYGTEILVVVLVTEYFSNRVKGVAVGFMESVAIIGWGSGALLSGYLYENMGMGFCFFLSSVAMLLSFFMFLKVRDLGQELQEQTLTDVFREGLSILKNQLQNIKKWLMKLLELNYTKIDDYLINFRNRKQIFLIFSATLMVSIGSGMITPFIVNFLEGRGVSETAIGLVFAIFGVIIFLPINRFAAGWLSDRYSARKVFSYAVMSYIVLWGVFNISIAATDDNTVILAIYAFPVWPFLYIGYKLFVTDFTDRSERARGLSSVAFAMGIGFVIGSIFGAILLYFNVTHEVVFQLAMIFILLAANMGYDILHNPIFDETTPIVQWDP